VFVLFLFFSFLFFCPTEAWLAVVTFCLLAIYALADDPGIHWHPQRFTRHPHPQSIPKYPDRKREGVGVKKGNAISGAILSKHSSKNGN